VERLLVTLGLLLLGSAVAAALLWRSLDVSDELVEEATLRHADLPAWPADSVPDVSYGRQREARARALHPPTPEGCADVLAFAVDLHRAGAWEAAVAGARLLEDLADPCGSLLPADVVAAQRDRLPSVDRLLRDAELVRQLTRYGHRLSFEQRLALPDRVVLVARDPVNASCVPCLPFNFSDRWDQAKAYGGGAGHSVPPRTIERVRNGREALEILAGR